MRSVLMVENFNFCHKMIKYKAFRINVGRIDRIMMHHMNLMIADMLISVVVKHAQ